MTKRFDAGTLPTWVDHRAAVVELPAQLDECVGTPMTTGVPRLAFGRLHAVDEVLEHCFDHVEYISLHTYLNDYANDPPAFLASPDLMDAFIDEVVAALRDWLVERAFVRRPRPEVVHRKPPRQLAQHERDGLRVPRRLEHLRGRALPDHPLARRDGRAAARGSEALHAE